MKSTSCGVLVTDGMRLLLGHAARSPRWDIPKGVAEPGESLIAAAIRELREETGLDVKPGALIGLGTHIYLKEKDLALFAWMPPEMPNPAMLSCASLIDLPGGGTLPELDLFGVFEWNEAEARVGRNLARVLSALRPGLRPRLREEVRRSPAR